MGLFSPYKLDLEAGELVIAVDNTVIEETVKVCKKPGLLTDCTATRVVAAQENNISVASVESQQAQVVTAPQQTTSQAQPKPIAKIEPLAPKPQQAVKISPEATAKVNKTVADMGKKIQGLTATGFNFGDAIVTNTDVIAATSAPAPSVMDADGIDDAPKGRRSIS